MKGKDGKNEHDIQIHPSFTDRFYFGEEESKCSSQTNRFKDKLRTKTRRSKHSDTVATTTPVALELNS
jgi:hypothetical protein